MRLCSRMTSSYPSRARQGQLQAARKVSARPMEGLPAAWSPTPPDGLRIFCIQEAERPRNILRHQPVGLLDYDPSNTPSSTDSP